MLNNFVQFSSENNTKNIKKKFLLLDYIGIKSLINSVLQDYCKENGLTFLDYFSPMADEKKGLRSDYGTDGVHPNKKGYSVMEQVLRETIPGII